MLIVATRPSQCNIVAIVQIQFYIRIIYLKLIVALIRSSFFNFCIRSSAKGVFRLENGEEVCVFLYDILSLVPLQFLVQR